MGIAASELCRYVIRPTLMYLGSHSKTAEVLLLALPPANRRWAQPCTIVVATASTASPNCAIKPSGTSTWHWIRNGLAWFAGSPASMRSSAGRTWN